MSYTGRNSFWLFLTAAIIALAGASGCTPKQPKQRMFEQWKARAERSQPIISRQKPRAGSPAASRPRPAPAKKEMAADSLPPLPTRNISVRFVNDDLVNVLRALGRMAGQNILINPGVTGTVNAHIENTPWNVVFTGLINSYGLVLRREGRLLRVMTVDDMKKQVERTALEKEQEQVAPLVTRVFPIEFANPDEISESIRPLLSKNSDGSPRGSLAVDRHSRSLIINDTEENMGQLTGLIIELDQPTPQILIEAHIVETSQDTARELGVQWGGYWKESLSDNRAIALTPGGINGETDATTGVTTYNAGVLGNSRTGIGNQGFAVDLPAAALGGFQPAAFGFMHFSSSGNILEMQLSALQKQGKVNILSEPSIVTLDNNEAVIESGRDIPYQTIENNSVKIEYKEASLKLTVTPHVISDSLIKLNIHAKKDEVDFSNSVAGNPMIIKKQAQTQLIVENGATVVIAGLSKERKSSGDIGVPGLKNLPFFGWMFKNDSRSAEFEEILIFITPKVLTERPAAVTAAETAGQSEQ